MNSRNLTDRIKMYEADGWTCDLDKMVMTKQDSNSKSSRHIPENGSFDPWYPLPAIMPRPELSVTDQQIVRCLDVNDRIANGEIFESIPCSDCPSAWVDHTGNQRNKNLYKKAYFDALKKIESQGPLYRRKGSKFIKI